MARVVLQNIVKRYPGVDTPAVADFNLEITEGEFLVLVGPSGCGKSTTLRMVAGLEEVTEGDILIGDRRVNDVAPKDRDIAMIFQNYALYPHMTVYQNMGFGLKMRRFPKPEIDRRVREAAETLGLTEYLNRKPKALSGGQRQRVAVGRAIVREPAVFLFDEPLSNLDAKMRVDMRNEIRRLHRRLGATMIYVTHDQVEAMTMGDRIVVMNEGRIQQVADPKSLYDEPNNLFVAGFIGSPPMNFIKGRLQAESGALAFTAEGLRLPIGAEASAALKDRAPGEIVLGIRPEALSETEQEGGATASFEAEIENREPLGAEVLLYTKAAGSSIVARLGADAQGKVGQTTTLHLNLRKMRFFDARTEQRIA